MSKKVKVKVTEAETVYEIKLRFNHSEAIELYDALEIYISESLDGNEDVLDPGVRQLYNWLADNV